MISVPSEKSVVKVPTFVPEGGPRITQFTDGIGKLAIARWGRDCINSHFAIDTLFCLHTVSK